MSNTSTALHLNAASLSKYKPTEIAEISAVLESLFLGKTPQPEGERRMVATSGGPATGKSQFAYLYELANPDFVRVDVNDNCLCAIPGYRADLKTVGFEAAYEKWRDASNVIAMEANKRAVAEGYNLLFVGTGTSPQAAKFIEDAVSKGYKAEMHGFAAPLAVALERNQAANRFGYLSADEREQVSFLLPENHVTEKRPFYLEALPRLAKVTEYFFQNWNPSNNVPPKLAFTFERASGLAVDDKSALGAFMKDAGWSVRGVSSVQVLEKKLGL